MAAETGVSAGHILLMGDLDSYYQFLFVRDSCDSAIVFDTHEEFPAISIGKRN